MIEIGNTRLRWDRDCWIVEHGGIAQKGKFEGQWVASKQLYYSTINQAVLAMHNRLLLQGDPDAGLDELVKRLGEVTADLLTALAVYTAKNAPSSPVDSETVETDTTTPDETNQAEGAE